MNIQKYDRVICNGIAGSVVDKTLSQITVVTLDGKTVTCQKDSVEYVPDADMNLQVGDKVYDMQGDYIGEVTDTNYMLSTGDRYQIVVTDADGLNSMYTRTGRYWAGEREDNERSDIASVEKVKLKVGAVVKHNRLGFVEVMQNMPNPNIYMVEVDKLRNTTTYVHIKDCITTLGMKVGDVLVLRNGEQTEVETIVSHHNYPVKSSVTIFGLVGNSWGISESPDDVVRVIKKPKPESEKLGTKTLDEIIYYRVKGIPLYTVDNKVLDHRFKTIEIYENDRNYVDVFSIEGEDLTTEQLLSMEFTTEKLKELELGKVYKVWNMNSKHYEYGEIIEYYPDKPYHYKIHTGSIWMNAALVTQ